MKDRISELPELVLSSILSYLTLKDVIKTSALSKEWKRQHRKVINTLNLDLPNLLESNYANDLESKYAKSQSDNFDQLLDVRWEFINRVQRVLRHFKSSQIKSFKVTFFMDSQVSCYIDCWIRSAIAFGVEEIQLLFSDKPLSRIQIDKHRFYKFPYWFFNPYFLKHLNLQRCILTPPLYFTGFSKLLTLSLEEVIVSQNFVDFLFTHSTFLQELTINCCYFAGEAPVLRIVSSSLHKLSLLYVSTLLKVEIIAVNLLFFKYWLVKSAKMTLFHAPRLANFHFYISETDTETPCLLSQIIARPSLEIVNIILEPFQVKKLQTAGTFQFRNLKELTLVYYDNGRTEVDDFIWVLDIVKACPVLQKFQFTFIHTTFPTNKEKMETLCGHAQKSLKEMKMSGRTVNWHEIELVIFLLKNEIDNKLMIVEPSINVYKGQNWLHFEHKSSWSESCLDTFLTSLRNNIPHLVYL
ncbi:putative F-box/FBD/LRR-repeat protein At5g22610 [Mercurialis annua]|uniref:putative F-box/FBD/LRR-repeat protein At5g22610 n=1 Tax=Mercurialis annua TaxID=3986 RepID=UPI00215E7403|nr:putative F-box/FBD/LRR-repeat protein At5g22610 [Mercurialis annua]